MIFEQIVYISGICMFLAYYIYRYVKYFNKYAILNIALQIVALTLLCLIYSNNQSMNIYIQAMIFVFGYVVPAITLLSIKFKINYIQEFKIIWADILAECKKYDKAISVYENVKEKYEKYIVYEKLGEIYLKNGNLKLALENLSNAVSVNPKRYNIYYKIAYIQFKLKNYDEAITILNNNLEYKPNKLSVQNMLAYMWSFNKNEYKKALDIYFEIIERNAKSAKTYYNIGATYIKEKQNKNAKKFLESAIQYDKKLYNAYYLLGYIHIQSKEYEEAEKCLQISTNGKDTYAKAYYMLARLYILQNEKGKATNCLNLAISKDDSFAKKMQEDEVFDSVRELASGVDKIEKIATGKVANKENGKEEKYFAQFEEINVDEYTSFEKKEKKKEETVKTNTKGKKVKKK